MFLNSSFRRLGTCEEFAFLLLQIKLLVEVGAKIGTKLRNPGFVVLVHVARRLVIDKAAEIVGTPEARRVIVHDLVGIEVAVPDGVGLADAVTDVAAALADPACVHDREGALALEKAFKAFIGVAVGELLGEDALNVALGDGVRRIVPVRIGEDDVVGGSDIGLLNGNVGGRFAKAVLGVEEGFNGENRVEADLVEVADFDFHAGLHEVVDGGVDEVPFDGFMARIADNEQHLLHVALCEAVGLDVLAEGFLNDGSGCNRIKHLGGNRGACGNLARGVGNGVGSDGGHDNGCAQGERTEKTNLHGESPVQLFFRVKEHPCDGER